jgi:hypothetical protein
MIDKLSAPFPPEAIHWRAQTVRKDGTQALALAYLDARDVMDRLDEVMSPAGWSDTFTETAKGRVICSLSLMLGDQWISKSDGAGDTAVEGEKGGISDAFKRAGVKWGIGRYLYDLGNVWAPCESRDFNNKKQFVKWKPEAERVFANALRALSQGAAAQPANPPETINDGQREKLMALLDSTNFPTDRLLSVSKIKDLRELPAARFDGAMKWIADEAKKLETQNA